MHVFVMRGILENRILLENLSGVCAQYPVYLQQTILIST